LRDQNHQRRMAEWVLGRETERRNSSTAKMHSMEADKHRLSDQVGQLQSNLDGAAFHRDLIVGMELQKKDPRVSGCQNDQVVYKQALKSRRRHPTKDAFESLVRTSSSGADRTQRTTCGFSGTSPSRLQLLKARERRIAASKSRS
jgi:hypothetical protein